jgi:HlyD family secretion protein
MKRVRKANLVWSAGVIIALIAATYYLFYKKTDAKIEYQFGKADRGEISVTISSTGSLEAVTTVEVGSQVSGTIANLYADFNSVVQEGQLLAQLDPTFLQATVNEQKANRDRSQAEVNKAKRDLDRVRQLFEKSLVSQADLDAALTAYETAEAGLKQAEASLQRAEVNLKYATIRAPISGVVISRDVEVGQTVAASLSAPTLFTIAKDLKEMQIEASVDEADIGLVKVGQKATFRVDAYPEDQFEGTVKQIRLSPVITSNVVTYTVLIGVNNPEEKLMPGMTATITIEVARSEDALRIPIAALRFTPSASEMMKARENGGNARAAAAPPGDLKNSARSNGWTNIWTLDNGNLRPIPIKKGIQNAKYVEVLESPLAPGDQVIIGTLGSASTSETTTRVQGQNPFMPGRPPGGGR